MANQPANPSNRYAQSVPPSHQNMPPPNASLYHPHYYPVPPQTQSAQHQMPESALHPAANDPNMMTGPYLPTPTNTNQSMSVNDSNMNLLLDLMVNRLQQRMAQSLPPPNMYSAPSGAVSHSATPIPPYSHQAFQPPNMSSNSPYAHSEPSAHRNTSNQRARSAAPPAPHAHSAEYHTGKAKIKAHAKEPAKPETKAETTSSSRRKPKRKRAEIHDLCTPSSEEDEDVEPNAAEEPEMEEDEEEAAVQEMEEDEDEEEEEDEVDDAEEEDDVDFDDLGTQQMASPALTVKNRHRLIRVAQETTSPIRRQLHFGGKAHGKETMSEDEEEEGAQEGGQEGAQEDEEDDDDVVQNLKVHQISQQELEADAAALAERYKSPPSGGKRRRIGSKNERGIQPVTPPLPPSISQISSPQMNVASSAALTTTSPISPNVQLINQQRRKKKSIKIKSEGKTPEQRRMDEMMRLVDDDLTQDSINDAEIREQSMVNPMLKPPTAYNLQPQTHAVTPSVIAKVLYAQNRTNAKVIADVIFYVNYRDDAIAKCAFICGGPGPLCQLYDQFQHSFVCLQSTFSLCFTTYLS